MPIGRLGNLLLSRRTLAINLSREAGCWHVGRLRHLARVRGSRTLGLSGRSLFSQLGLVLSL
jgi:hypothetical protein